MYTKKNTRVTFRSNKRSNFKRNNNYSNNKPRNKGNVTQQYNKYLKLAKESFSSGDRIQSEYYYQFTDHYYRLMLELGINLEETDSEEIKQVELEEASIENNTLNDDKKDEEIKQNEKVSKSLEESDENIESIESIPFISQPVKKKPVKNKKASA